MTTTTATPLRPGQRRTERRLIPPFGDGTDPNALSNVLDGMLAKCRFSPFTDVPLLEGDSYVLSIDDAEKPICPRFELVVDQLDDLGRRLSRAGTGTWPWACRLEVDTCEGTRSLKNGPVDEVPESLVARPS